MGVIHIQEENPLNEFLKGISPMATAWGDRYIQRDIANTLNKYQEYKNGKNNNEASPEYFFNMRDLQDTSNTPYFTTSASQTNPSSGADYLYNPKFGRTPPEPSQYHNMKPVTIDTIIAPVGQSQSTTPVAPYSGNQISMKTVNQGNMERDRERAGLMRRGASTIGALGMGQLLNDADRSYQLKNRKYDVNTSPLEFYRNIAKIYLNNGDPQSAFNYYRPADDWDMRNRLFLNK